MDCGDAIIGTGRKTRIRVAVTLGQRAHGRPRTDGNRRRAKVQDARLICVLHLDRSETPHFSIRC